MRPTAIASSSFATAGSSAKTLRPPPAPSNCLLSFRHSERSEVLCRIERFLLDESFFRFECSLALQPGIFASYCSPLQHVGSTLQAHPPTLADKAAVAGR